MAGSTYRYERLCPENHGIKIHVIVVSLNQGKLNLPGNQLVQKLVRVVDDNADAVLGMAVDIAGQGVDITDSPIVLVVPNRRLSPFPAPSNICFRRNTSSFLRVVAA